MRFHTILTALALGAAIGSPASCMSLLAIGCEGILIATVESPPVVSFGIQSAFFMIIVSGPGQNLSASRYASSGTSLQSFFSSAISAICTISGLSEGLPFAA